MKENMIKAEVTSSQVVHFAGMSEQLEVVITYSEIKKNGKAVKLGEQKHAFNPLLTTDQVKAEIQKAVNLFKAELEGAAERKEQDEKVQNAQNAAEELKGFTL